MKQTATMIASEIIDMRDEDRKNLLKSYPSDLKCQIVEQMVRIRLERLRGPDGIIRPVKVTER